MGNEWIKICECQVPEPNTKIWLQELLEENNIPYREDIKYWNEGRHRKYVYKYDEKLVIYIPSEYKQQVEKYIEEYNKEENMLTDDIEELQTDEDTEYESKEFAKKQQIMQRALVGIVVAMVVSFFIAGIFAK